MLIHEAFPYSTCDIPLPQCRTGICVHIDINKETVIYLHFIDDVYSNKITEL